MPFGACRFRAYHPVIVSLIAITIYRFSSISSLGIAAKFPPANANLQKTSLKMQSLDIESVDPIIKQLVERQANAWETANIEKLLADFAEDSVFVVPGSIYRGKQQIKQAAESYFRQFTDTKVTIKRVIVQGDEGAVEWTWSEKNKETGEKAQADDAIIFELESGKIKYWREYIDKEVQEK
jgi:uncharacterized protein (TIGR02246 family)